MSQKEGNYSPKDRKYPAKQYFDSFRFSHKRGLYLLDAVIDKDRPASDQEHYSKRIFRVLRRSVPNLTLVILAANALIYGQQCRIMSGQSQTMNAQATTMATQAAILKSQNEISASLGRSRMIVVDDKGTLAEFLTLAGEDYIVFYVRNVGHSPAKEVNHNQWPRDLSA